MFKKLYYSYIQTNHPERQVAESDIDNRYIKQLFFRIITRFLLVCYSLMVFKPVLPMVIDVLAHHFWKEAHLRIVHKENGKEHVHYELAKSVEGSEKDKSADKSKNERYETSEYTYLTVFFSHLPQVYEELLRLYCSYRQFYPVSYTDPEYIPPKA